MNIEVGMLINNVYNFEASHKTFDADGWIWLKWPPEIEQAMKQHHVLPQELFYFFNLVNGYDSSVIPAGLAPKRTPDGGYYTRFQFTGHFIANELNFRKFPFQTLKFPLALEIRQSTRLGLDYPVGMKIDYKNSGLGAYIDLGGYITEVLPWRAIPTSMRAHSGTLILGQSLARYRRQGWRFRTKNHRSPPS